MSKARSSNVPGTVMLPQILTQWPWPRQLSKYYKVAGAESTAWIESFHPFEGHSLEAFKKCDFSLLASLTYSPRDKSFIRLACDMLHLAFVFDEYTDVEGKQGCRIIYHELQDVLADPDKYGKPKDTPVVGITRDFWLRARALVPPDASCIRHFVDTCTSHMKGVAQEADDRTNKRYRSFEDYMHIRKNSAGGAPMLAFIEFGLDLPDDAFNHPVVASLRDKAEIMIALVNDIYSYVMEKSRGLAVHNGVEVLMYERNISIQEAMNWLGNYCNEVADSFLAELKSLPSWGVDVDARVTRYVNGLGQWVRGTADWHLESGRYFGDEVDTVKQTRIATLIPPSCGYVQLPIKASTYDEM